MAPQNIDKLMGAIYGTNGGCELMQKMITRQLKLIKQHLKATKQEKEALEKVDYQKLLRHLKRIPDFVKAPLYY